MNLNLIMIENILNYHRNIVKITCEETCWCWDIEEAINKYQKNKENWKIK